MKFDAKGYDYHALGDNLHLYNVDSWGRATDLTLPMPSGGGGSSGSVNGQFADLEALGLFGYSHDHYTFSQYDFSAWQFGDYSGSSWSNIWTNYDLTKSWSSSGETMELQVSYGRSWGDNYAGPGYQFGEYHYDARQYASVFSEYFGKDGNVSLFSQQEQAHDSFDFKSFASPNYVSETGHSAHSDMVDTNALSFGPHGFSFLNQHVESGDVNDTFHFANLQTGVVIDQQHTEHTDLAQTSWGNQFGQGSGYESSLATHDYVQVLGPDFVQTDVHDVATQVVHDHGFFLI